MKKNIDTKLAIAIIVVVAILLIGIGFAAFTSSLTIGATATVNPTSDFVVNPLAVVTTEPTAGTASTYGTYCVNATAAISGTSGNKTVTVTTNTFTNKGQSATCYIPYKNESTNFTGYLQAVPTLTKSCDKTASSTATDSLATAACNGLTATLTYSATYDGTYAALTAGNSIAPEAVQWLKLVIEYPSSATLVDGEIESTWTISTLNWSTASN